jgi:hypothetical protein
LRALLDSRDEKSFGDRPFGALYLVALGHSNRHQKKVDLAINPYTPHERREWIEAQRP